MDTPTTSQPSFLSQYSVPLSIIIAGLAVGGGLYFGLAQKSSVVTTGQGNGQPQQTLNTTVDQIKATIKPATAFAADAAYKGKSAIVLGSPDAPITMQYWYDYQCPFCRAVDVGSPLIPTAPSMGIIIDKYVKTGKVRIIFNSFPFLGNDSITAAEYAHAIWHLYPDLFFTWHSGMMLSQDAEGDQGFGNAATIDILNSLIPGIDVNAVKQYITDNKSDIDAAIKSEQKNGSDHGVQGTPGFIIGGKLLDGAQPPKVFIDAIEAVLKK